ncbi:rhamnogalacturonase B [Colletotrichum cuscutae]|uniref:Rhamnogalacturonase B n=1 Tax=Colletotrichum cuscutae TaxID=1209917 RepID=A0AAI9Y9N6_9PEZI|nr:rhamnogalacturonase B [Colletotrichum cuscutae]
MYTLGFLSRVSVLVRTAFGDFDLTTSDSTYTIDTNGGLVFEVNRPNGDITSLLYDGVQFRGTSKMSQINSGLGTSTVTADTLNGHVKITVKASSQPLTHYYVAKPGDPTIYMATHITVPTGVHGDVADLDGCVEFEGKDTFKCLDDTTRCKMYTSEMYTSDRFIDDQIHGMKGDNVGVWMIMPGNAYEHSAGGPLMRDINSQSTSDQELYWYMNSGHVRTEPWRFGHLWPHAMRFTSSTRPPSADVDMSFFDSLNIDGYVPHNVSRDIDVVNAAHIE